MMNFETENMEFKSLNMEFKSLFTEDIYKEVIAFANTNGGILYIGMDDNGNAGGLTDVNSESTRITNGIRDAIMPDVTMFVKFTIQENRVVRITVNEGSNKPYYLKSKGLKPSGVYIRQGASGAQASPDQIRAMIKNTDGDIYEEMRCMNQELTFEAAKAAFDQYKVAFGEDKYRALGMVKGNDSLYTNLACLVSDQCTHTVKVAVFGDGSKTVFRDSKEFGGSVFTQLEDTFDYLRLCNKTVAKFNGLERIETSDYPEEAMREALLNAIVHRDYGYSGSIIINVNDHEMEFISIGGLLPGLSIEDIKSGISQPRNKNLSVMFHRLHLVESYGTGIRRIYHHYADCPVQPRVEVTPHTFKIVLPNMNTAKAPAVQATRLTPGKAKILDYIKEHGQITESKIQVLLNVGKTRAYSIAREMCEEGWIVAIGRGATKVYKEHL